MSVKQDIYKTLIQSGMTQAGALAMMGNMKCESGLEANRVQGDFSSFRTVSKSYVARVTRGDISRYNFAHDDTGFGLLQWTFYTRKYDLYDFWKKSGKNLDDAEMQVQFALMELKRDYNKNIYVKDEDKWVNLWNLLTTSNDLFECTKYICKIFERPTVNNINDRYTAAVALKAELVENPSEKQEKPVEPVKETYYPYRMICKGMSGDDVIVLQAILKCRGYDCNRLDGVFDERTKNRALAFQAEHTDVNGVPLTTDGIIGKKTWGALLQY